MYLIAIQTEFKNRPEILGAETLGRELRGCVKREAMLRENCKRELASSKAWSLIMDGISCALMQRW